MITTTATSTSTTTPATTAITATDSASIGSALATALGGGTGVDMTQLATNVASAEFASQLANIDHQATQLTTRISETAQLRSDLLALSSSFASDIETGGLAATPTVANAAVASATLPAGSSGATSSYSLEVTRLAASQVLASPTYSAGTAAAGSGTLTINPGTVTGSTFTASAGAAPVTITIPSGATLNDVAAAINSSAAGITAYVATSSTGAQLVLKGGLGAAQGFTISASEAAGDPGLAALAWNPAGGDPARLAQRSTDASYNLDGIARTSSTNTIDTAAPGLSLQLTGTNIGNPTTISYSNPASGITTAMQSFTTALNAITGEVSTDTAAGSGALSSDLATRNVRSLLSQLSGQVIMPDAAPGAPATLADLGLTVNKDGSFTLDGATLTAALQKSPAAVAAMFTTGLNGVYGTLFTMTQKLTSTGTVGSLDNAVSTYTTDQTNLTTARAAVADKQTTLRTRLVAQYAAANAEVAQSKSTMAYLTAQIAVWTNQTSSSSSR